MLFNERNLGRPTFQIERIGGDSMAKHDETFDQFEAIVSELKKGRAERTATSALGQNIGPRHASRALWKYIFMHWGGKIIITVLFLFAIFAGFWLLSGNKVAKENTTFVEQVQDLATLATAEAHLKVVIEQEDNKLFGNDISINLPGTKRELLLIVPATVIAGVNLKELTSNDVKVNEKERVIEIALPRAAFIQDPAIQMDKVRTFSDEGLLSGETKWDEGFDLAAEAQEKVKEEAIEIGLLQTAEQNAKRVLKEFFGNLGYTVKLTFK